MKRLDRMHFIVPTGANIVVGEYDEKTENTVDVHYTLAENLCVWPEDEPLVHDKAVRFGKCVYLSGGIKDFSASDKHDWRERAKGLLNCPSVDPTRVPYDGRNPAHIVELDKTDIQHSSHVLVYYIRPSVGTSMEIFYAWERKKTVYVVNEGGADLSPWMLYHSTKVFNTLEEAVEQIKKD